MESISCVTSSVRRPRSPPPPSPTANLAPPIDTGRDGCHPYSISLRASLSSIFQPRAALVVLGPCRKPAAELEVPLVENPDPRLRTSPTGGGTKSEHYVHHDRGGLPLARRNTRIQMGRTGLEKRLPDIRPDPPTPLNSNSLFTHSCRPLLLGDSCEGLPRGAAIASGRPRSRSYGWRR